MFKYEIIVRTQYNKLGSTIPEEVMADFDNTLDRITNTFGGFSILYVDGSYKSQNETIVNEVSAVITILTYTERYVEVRRFAELFKEVMDQESVILLTTELEGDFI